MNIFECILAFIGFLTIITIYIFLVCVYLINDWNGGEE